MITHYLSHPFSGDEEKNRAEAEEIQRELQEKYPDMLYISPIANFKAPEGMKYETIMRYCLALLEKCDVVTVTGRYWESKGCMMEIIYAYQKGIPVLVHNSNEYVFLHKSEIAF